jgi:membrane fusion protein, copper/silver efflux system
MDLQTISMTKMFPTENASLLRTAKIASAGLVLVGAVVLGYLYGSRGTTVPVGASQHAVSAQYTCPMHPFIIAEHPGSCPICNMELVKKVSGAGISERALSNVRHVALSPTQQVMANLATAPATVRPFSKEISATGVVAYNQERQGKVTAWLSGRLDRLLVKSVGARVDKGKPIAEVYSYEMVTAQEEYLLAYKALRLFGSTIVPTFNQNSMGTLFDAKQRLRQMGFSERQFDELQKSGKPTVRIPITSPLSGVVTEKHAQEGQFVNVGDPLFSVADLSLIWVELEVFESDLPNLKVGQEVAIVSTTLGGAPLHGRIKLIYPFLDPKTRTVKVRVELPNPGLKLKPEMYVSAQIKVPAGPSLTVAQDSVVDTGKRKVVWVETSSGIFQPREVSTGMRSGDQVQILSGLQAGEKVALKGGYLIDSESQLAHGPQEPPRSDLDMGDMKMTPQ